jgi:hypothetical protein
MAKKFTKSAKVMILSIAIHSAMNSFVMSSNKPIVTIYHEQTLNINETLDRCHAEPKELIRIVKNK